MIEEIILKVNDVLPGEFVDSSNFAGYEIPEFIDDVYDLLGQYFKYQNEFKGITFNATASYEALDDTESIALRHKILSREYGQVESNKISSSALKSPMWTKIDDVTDTNFPGYNITIRRQVYDTVVEFTPWSKNRYESDKFAFLLENIFDEYDVVFKKKGLQLMRFMNRGEDEIKVVGGTTWYGAPLRYFVSTIKLKREFNKKLEKLNIQIQKR